MKAMNYLFLSAVLIAPVVMVTSAKAQDDRRQEEHQRENQKQVRVYDRAHKDYHNWDDNEDRSYRAYLGEQHQDYREYSKLKRNQQNQYWNWRHEHPEGGQERH